MAVNPSPWYLKHNLTAEEFFLDMLALGTPIEVSLVGVFDKGGSGARGSRRDIELPPHKDGVYSAKLAAAQAGHYVEQPGIDIVGLYCLQEGNDTCLTTINNAEDESEIAAVELRKGDALIFDNNAVMHGRRGTVGPKRILVRMWIKRHEKST